MAGTWTFTGQYKADAENYIAGTNTGTYNVMQKISQNIASTGGSLSVESVTVANLQSIFLQADQDCTIVFTLATGTKSIALVASQCYEWDVATGQANPFAYNIVSAVVNFTGTAPNITARIASL